MIEMVLHPLCWLGWCKHSRRSEMREPGLEPGSLSTPDPKADPSPEVTPTAEPNLAPAATQIPPDDTPGTTQNATREAVEYCDGCGGLALCTPHGERWLCGDCAP